MDLIIANENGEDIEVIKGFQLDLAYGSDENDFELKQKINGELYKPNYRIYIEGTEYGGIIDDITIDTDAEEVTYHGRTWHGILNSKIVCPDDGEAYKKISGDIVDWISEYFTEAGLDSLFSVPSQDAHTVSYTFDRYCKLYSGGLLKALTRNDLKLILKYYNGKVLTYIKPMTLYSDSEDWSEDKIELTISRDYNKVNHLICLGSGELADRQRVDLYSDANGNISEIQTFTGLDEVAEIYDYSNVESLDKLKSDGIEELKSRRGADSIETNLADSDIEYDIGDKIEETENLSNLRVTEKIVKKIVTMTDSDKTVSYEVGGTSVTSSSKSTDSSSGGSVAVPTKVSELENDSGFITSSSLPTKVSELTNDSGFVTSDYHDSSKQDASTAITTSNIGSQSVSYASTSGYSNAIGNKNDSDKNSANGNGWYSVGAANTTPSIYSHAPLALNWYWGIDARTSGGLFHNGYKVLDASNSGNYEAKSATYYGSTSKILIYSNNNSIKSFENGSTYLECIPSSGTAKGISWWDSDKRLKKNIADTSITNALEIVNKIEHRAFDWIDESLDSVKCGYVADELENVIEEAVFDVAQPEGSEYESIKNINHTTLIPYLSKAIQELSAKVDSLEAELKELKGE